MFVLRRKKGDPRMRSEGIRDILKTNGVVDIRGCGKVTFLPDDMDELVTYSLFPQQYNYERVELISTGDGWIVGETVEIVNKGDIWIVE